MINEPIGNGNQQLSDKIMTLYFCNIQGHLFQFFRLNHFFFSLQMLATIGYCKTYSNNISNLLEFWNCYDLSSLYLIYYHFAVPVLISFGSDLPSRSVVILFVICFMYDKLKYVWNVAVITYFKFPSLSIISRNRF